MTSKFEIVILNIMNMETDAEKKSAPRNLPFSDVSFHYSSIKDPDFTPPPIDVSGIYDDIRWSIFCGVPSTIAAGRAQAAALGTPPFTETPDMDHKHRQLLNRFGLVRDEDPLNTKMADEDPLNTKMADEDPLDTKMADVDPLDTKMADEDPLDTLTGDLEKSAPDSHQVKDVPSPIFSRNWQAVLPVSTAGGALCQPGSDVTIEVPAGAVADGVAMNTAVCTDTGRVARVLGLQGGEYVCTPLAEYWAGHDFRFQKHVRITLPHFLPPQPDLRLVRVYRLTCRPDGHITITRLRQHSASGTHTHQVNVEARVPGNADHTDMFWEDTATFQLTSDGSIYVTTDRLSGYVCTYCGQRKPPVLNVLVCGRHSRGASGHQTAIISVHLWDGRLHIRDFRQDYGIAVHGDIVTSNTLDVIPELPDSRLHILFALGIHCDEDWQFSLDVSHKPMTPAKVCRELRNLCCSNSSCNTSPISSEWMLATQHEQQTRHNLTGVIKVCQVARDQLPEWSQRDGIEAYICLPVELPTQKCEFEPSSQTDKTEKQGHTHQVPATPLHTVGQRTLNSYADSQPIAVLPQEVCAASGHQNCGRYPKQEQRAPGYAAHSDRGYNTQLKQWSTGSAPQCDMAAGYQQRSSPSSPEGALVTQQMERAAESFQRHFPPKTYVAQSAQLGLRNAGHSDNVYCSESLQGGCPEKHDQDSAYPAHQNGCYGNGHVATTGEASEYVMFPVNRQDQGLANGVEHFEAANSINHYSEAAVGSTSVVHNHVHYNYNYNPVNTHNNSVGKVRGEYNVASSLHSNHLVKHSDRSLKGTCAQYPALEGPHGVDNGEESAFVDFENEPRDLPAGNDDGYRPYTNDEDGGSRSEEVVPVTSKRNGTRTPPVAPSKTSERGAGLCFSNAGHEDRNPRVETKWRETSDVESGDITNCLLEKGV